jgi:ABC-2 type transport system ATP-binding protein
MIEITDLTFGYKKKKVLFNQLNLTLPQGNVYGLLGKNGAGKTSLLKMIAGLLAPQQGECKIMGEHAKMRYPDVLQDIFFLPEEFHVSPITIREYESIYAPFYPKFNNGMFLSLLDEFGLHESEKLTALSYGQKKKFLLGFGLSTNASVMLLDEPTNGLDIPSKSQFRKIIASAINEERSFIISTHQVRDLESLIDPIIIINDGKIIFYQNAEEISNKLAFKKVGDHETTHKILYAEEILGAKNAIIENTKNEITKIDLELLFNGVITDNNSICENFKK